MAQESLTHSRHVKYRDRPVADQRQGDDPHRLLGVGGAVGEGHEGGGDDLQPAETDVERPRRLVAEDPQDGEHEEKTDDGADDRREDQGRMIFCRPAQCSTAEPAWATTAPMTPPIRAWEEEEGRP